MATGTNDPAGRLTTHVLDTALGRPAGNLRIDLFKVTGTGREFVASTRTNDDGRCDGPLLVGASLTKGVYELTFHVGEYLRGQSAEFSEPAFFDEVPIRFGINDESQHYHVPLLVSPFAFSTYRGS